MTLLTCSLVLFGVALLASASLRSQQDGISLTYSNIDRLLAQQAAESALRDAAVSLTMIPEDGAIGQALGSHRLGDITGEHFPYGGPGQSCAAPEYFLEPLSQSGSADTTQHEPVAPSRYRVTATGKGISQATMVLLEAEFEALTCGAVQGSGAQTDDQATGLPDAECTPRVRRLAWRLLRAS
jgi:Tfp pilus assembly protein PilX